jgi:methionine-rich copper-binding protein CopC
MNKKIIWVAIVIAVALFFWLTWPKPSVKTQPVQPAASASNSVNNNTNINLPKPTTIKQPAAPKISGYIEKKTPHFVSATIGSNATLTQAPSNLTLTFDTTLSKNTQAFLIVKKNDITSITMNSSSIYGKTMSVRLNPNVTDGDYYVYYVACFADTGCKDGRFGYHLKLP